jgi:outer membrane lipoprotein SlyB
MSDRARRDLVERLQSQLFRARGVLNQTEAEVRRLTEELAQLEVPNQRRSRIATRVRTAFGSAAGAVVGALLSVDHRVGSFSSIAILLGSAVAGGLFSSRAQGLIAGPD